MKAINIKWETDGYAVDLPNEVDIPERFVDKDGVDVEAVSDWLSDGSGWLHDGFEIVDEVKMETLFFNNETVIVTENINGDMYLLKSKYIQDILDDWNGNCDFVPPNDARVYFASWNGKVINPYEYKDFGTLIDWFRELQR